MYQNALARIEANSTMELQTLDYSRLDLSMNPRLSTIDDRLRRLRDLRESYLGAAESEKKKTPARRQLLELKTKVRDARRRLETHRAYRARLRPPACFADVMAEVHLKELTRMAIDAESESMEQRAYAVHTLHVELSPVEYESPFQFA